jgi:multiple sugar transport system substrate-binding protein
MTTGAPGSPDRTIGVAGLADGSIRLGRWERFVWQNGGELFNKEFTKSQFSSPAAAGAFAFVSELHTKDRSLVTSDDAKQLVSSGSAFLSGKVGMHYGIARDGITSAVDAAKQAGFELGLVALPKGKSGRQNLDGPQGYGIGSATKAPEAAWELVKWWADEQRQAERLELAASVPVRKSMQRHKAFTGNLRPFETAATLEESAKSVRAPYSPPNLEDLEKIVYENWASILSGQKAVGAAVEDMTRQMDGQLKGV